MPTWDQLERFTTNAGLAVFLVVAFVIGTAYSIRWLGLLLRPHIENWFAKQDKWFDNQIEVSQRVLRWLDAIDQREHRKRKGFISLGRAVHAGAPDEKAAEVKRHIDEMTEHFEE